MKLFATALLASGCLALGACWTEGDDQAAENVEAVFSNEAETYQAEAGNASGAAEERLEDSAEVMRETGEAAADAVDDADLQTNGQ